MTEPDEDEMEEPMVQFATVPPYTIYGPDGRPMRTIRVLALADTYARIIAGESGYASIEDSEGRIVKEYR